LDLGELDADFGPAATPAAIDAAERALGLALPVVIRAFLAQADGAMFGSGVVLYDADSLPERNETYEVATYAKGFVGIGDDSGGRMFLMRAAPGERVVFSSDMGDMNPTNFARIADDFDAWLRGGCHA
jgi:hypothetical protein